MPLEIMKEVSVLSVINLCLRSSPPEVGGGGEGDIWGKPPGLSVNQHCVCGAWVGLGYSGHMLGWVERAEGEPVATSFWVVESLGTQGATPELCECGLWV